MSPNPFWSPDGRSVYYSRMEDGNVLATRNFRSIIDPGSGTPAGAESEFFRLDGYLFSSSLLNTISATREYVYFVLTGGMSDIGQWTCPSDPVRSIGRSY